jgi:polyphosphate kinase 2 (PPK2 family)
MAMKRLAKVDLEDTLPRDEALRRLAAAQERLLRLRLTLGGQIGGETAKLGPPLCVVFEGWDASGKGGSIKRLVDHLDPRHVRVAQFAAPTCDEKRHHFVDASKLHSAAQDTRGDKWPGPRTARS